ncbi:uncharacterized protein [Petaurus breviceps papuanus]|uniref:uncharacterized protein n=1 Tax=Petaurus breviceps papuanus TaxID=3040969 RepID=UPI0036D92210
MPLQAAQVNDPRKYAVSEVLVRVLATNHHPPHFSLPHHTAFVSKGPDTATLLVTYGGTVLSLHAVDPDFPNGVNPNLWYKLVPEGNHSQLFSVTRDGLLLAKPNQLQPQETYFLQVIAQDEESGEVANTTVSVEVLPLGQAVPPDPSELSSPPSVTDRVVVVGSLSLAVLFLAAGFGLGIWALRRWQRYQESSKQTALADEKHPNVLLVSQRLQDQVKDGKLGPNQGSFYFQSKDFNEPEASTDKGPRRKRAPSTGAKSPLLPTSGDEGPGSKAKTLPNGRIPEPVMALRAVWPRESSHSSTENIDTMTGNEVIPYQGERTGEDHPEKPEGETQMGGNRRPQSPREGPRDVAPVSNHMSREEINFP